MNIQQEVSEGIYGNSQNIVIRKQQDDDTLINSSNTSMPIYTVEEIKDYNDNKTDNEMIFYELEENVNISSANIFPKNFKLTKISNQNAVAEELKLTKISNENNEVDPMFSGIVDVYFSNVSYCAQYDKEEHEGLKKELSNKNCKLVFEDNKNKYEFQSNNNEAYILALVTLGNGVYNYDYGDNADAQTTCENQEGNKRWVYCKNANSIKNCHDSNAYRGLFYGSEAIKIEIINSGNNIQNMNKMFYRCSSLTSLNLSNFNTEEVTNMSWMFGGCNSLTRLNLSNFKTTNVTNMSYMFYNCNKLKKLNLKSFTTLKVIDMNNMFYGCNALRALDLSSFNTTNVTNMNSMFYNCSSLIELNLSRFRTENVNMKYMFENCFQGNTDVVLRCPKKDILDHIKSNYNSITIKHAADI